MTPIIDAVKMCMDAQNEIVFVALEDHKIVIIDKHMELVCILRESPGEIFRKMEATHVMGVGAKLVSPPK